MLFIFESLVQFGGGRESDIKHYRMLHFGSSGESRLDN